MKTSPVLFSLASAASLLAACRIYVDRPATSSYGYAHTAAPAPRPAPPPPAQTIYSPPPRRRPASPVGTASALADSVPGSTCFDTGSSPTPDCSQLRLPAGCTSAAYAQQKCAAYRKYFDPKVATDALACLADLGARTCDQGATNTCGRTSLAKACTDGSLGQLCSVAATKCGSSQVDCDTLLSGLNDDGKEKVAACIAKGCSGSLGGCVDALLPEH